MGMNRFLTSLSTLAPLVALVAPLGVAAHEHDHAARGEGARVQFVANHGQWPDAVRFKASFPASAMFLEGTAATWVRYQDNAPDLVHEYIQWLPERQASFRLNGHAWRMHFEGANPAAIAEGETRRKEYHNYFIGNDPSKWASRVPVYEGVHYEQIWAGVDMRWYSDKGNMKYDLMLAAGADASNISFRYEGLDGLSVDAKGDLTLRTSVGELTELRPVAWYADDHSPLACAFALNGDRVSFSFPQGLDATRAVVIDPLLMGATYSGQVGASNYGHCSTYDEDGHMYGGAQNFGAGFPTTLGAFQSSPGGGWGTDIVVNKFTADAVSLLMATYLGGDADDKPHSMIVNSSNELCVLGSSTGPNFPTSTGAYDASHNGGSDIVLVHLNEDGTDLMGSTYLGGNLEDGRQMITNNYGDTYRGEIMLDGAENIYIASSSQSTDFPVTVGAYQGALAGAQDAVVVGVDPACSNLLMSTFLGGSMDDNGLGLRFDGLGGIYVCGGTMSADFPMAGGGWQNTYQGAPKDGYIVRLTNNGSTLDVSTYFGTAADDMAYFIDLDNDNDVYIYGQSNGDPGITPAGIYGQPGGGIFLAAFDPALTAPVFKTTLGENTGWGFPLAPVAFLVDVCEHIYISGYNPSGVWETSPDALYEAGFSQFYLAAYDVDMASLLFGTYYGGSHVDGGTSRFDKDGIIYQGVCSGGNSMPTTPGCYAPNNNVGWDLGVFKIDFQVAGVNAAGASTLNSGCAPVSIDFSNTSTGTEWVWDFGDGSPPVSEFEPSHTFTEPGAFTVMMIAMDSLSCNLADTTYLPITIGEQQPIVAAFTMDQSIDCTLLEISTENNSTGTPLAFEWNISDGAQYNDTNIVHNFDEPGDYTVQLIAYDPTGCSTADTAETTIDIGPPLQVEAAFTIEESPGCDELTITGTDESTVVTPSYTWTMGDGTTYNTADVTHFYDELGTFTVTLIVNDPGTCNLADTAEVEVTVEPSVPVTAAFTAEQAFDCEDMLLGTDNQSTGTNLVFDWQVSDGAVYTDTNFTHTISGAGTYTVILNVSDALGCSPPQSDTLEVVIEPLEPVVAAFDASQVNNCDLLHVSTINQSTGDSVSYSWDMGDGTIIEAENAEHEYTDPGTYTITLTITDLGCGQNDETTLQVALINELPVALLNDSVICPDDVAVLNVQASDVTYLWNTGETAASISVDEPGTYTVTIDDGLCTGTASADIIAAPRHDLTDSIDACPGSQVDLVVPIDGLSFSWSTGGTERVERVLGSNALYTYDMIDLWGCPHTDSIRVFALDSVPQVFVPNAFTPDGDGINDVFRIAGFGERTVGMSVFNRWGEMLWATAAKEPFWDSRYGGSIVQDGVYVYRLEYTGVCDPETQEVYGHITVVK